MCPLLQRVTLVHLNVEVGAVVVLMGKINIKITGGEPVKLVLSGSVCIDSVSININLNAVNAFTRFSVYC